MKAETGLTIDWAAKSFDNLKVKELYDILALRNTIFIVEQNCPYLDIDHQDQLAYHLLGYRDDELIAYARLFVGESTAAKIGRLLVKASARHQSIGHETLSTCINVINAKTPNASISISAQTHLTEFYQKHGFRIEGTPYLEDNIPHIKMIRSSIKG